MAAHCTATFYMKSQWLTQEFLLSYLLTYLFQMSMSVRFQTVDVITSAPTLRVATSAPVWRTWFWVLMEEVVDALRAILRRTTLHVKVGFSFNIIVQSSHLFA